MYQAAVALIQEAVELLAEVTPVDKAAAVACKIAADYGSNPERDAADNPQYIIGSVH